MCYIGACSDCERAKDKENAQRIIGGYIGFWSGMLAGATRGSAIPIVGIVPGAIAGRLRAGLLPVGGSRTACR